MLTDVPALEGYELEGFLGRGAMGAVYRARQTSVDRTVAIKQVAMTTELGEEGRLRFLREAQTLARLRHPNIISIYDLLEEGSSLYMVTEYVEGVSLQEVIDTIGISPTAGLRVIADLASALEAARQQEVVHRDLKPGNVFVTSAGVCKLGDFGLARLVEGEQAYATQVATVLGTPAYMSPEQAEGLASIDHRTDLYSLAALSYQLLVGKLPFDRGADVLATLEAQVSEPPPRPTKVSPGFPRDVEKVLLEGLAKDPRKRQRSALAFWQQLEAAADRRWSGWRQQSDLAALSRQVREAADAGAGGAAAATPGTMVARVTGVHETMLEALPAAAEAPAPLATTMAPLATTVAPLATTVAPLATTLAPLATTVAPLNTTGADVETLLMAIGPRPGSRRRRPSRGRVLLSVVILLAIVVAVLLVIRH